MRPRLVMRVQPSVPARHYGSWEARCRICGWYQYTYRREDRARHAAAQHLWNARGEHHRQEKAPRARSRVVVRVEECPTPTKKRHPDREEALGHIRSLYVTGRGNPDYRAYLCKCGAWHVGHSAASLSRRIRKAIR